MTFHIITLFPEVFDAYFKESIIGKAIKKRLIEVKFYDLRDFSKDKKRKKASPTERRQSFGRVDEKVYGGGPGMVLGIEPLVRAIEKATARQTGSRGKRQGTARQTGSRDKRQVKIILLAPGGRQFDNKIAQDLTKYKDVVLIAGRYEGVDERVKKIFSAKGARLPNGQGSPARGGQAASGWKIEEISVGPYVLTGGEIPAMVVVDAVSRQIKGVLGKNESLEEKRYGVGVPVYTRPEIFKYKGKNYRVPKVLLSGDHKEIAAWRKEKINNKFQISNDK